MKFVGVDCHFNGEGIEIGDKKIKNKFVISIYFSYLMQQNNAKSHKTGVLFIDLIIYVCAYEREREIAISGANFFFSTYSNDFFFFFKQYLLEYMIKL